MATIKEYLKYYKSLTFNECKLNINDVLLFTELSYIDWHNIFWHISVLSVLRALSFLRIPHYCPSQTAEYIIYFSTISPLRHIFHSAVHA